MKPRCGIVLLLVIWLLYLNLAESAAEDLRQHGSTAGQGGAITRQTAPSEDRFLYAFMAGSYHVIGKHPDSSSTYYGKVRFENRGTYLAVTRDIEGLVVSGSAHLEYAVHGEARVLRVRFRKQRTDYLATYQWLTDLDNYPVFSGTVVPQTKRTRFPGLETLFFRKRVDDY